MKHLIERQNISDNLKVSNAYQQLGKLLNALEEKRLSTETVDLINNEIVQLNSISVIDKIFLKTIKENENRIVELVEKRHKIISKNFYKKLWMVLGMSAFGIPIGVTFSLSIGNYGLLAIGIGVGMAVGVGVGSSMDKKAFDEGRQLNIELKS